jgi:hypothetical protein
VSLVNTLRALGLAAGFLALSGCSDRPDDVPSPAPGLLARLGDACPDLRGTYAFGADGKRRRFPGTALATVSAAPRHHSRWSIVSLDASALVIRSLADAEDQRRGLEHWREDNAYGYALWSQSLEPRRVPGGIELVKRADATLAEPADVPRSREFVIPGDTYRCEDGWLVFIGEDEPDADDADRAAVRMTRASDGGLVARWRFRRSRSFSLWCGDGCKPNLPLPDERVERWWHAPPATVPDPAPVDWQALVAADPRPRTVRERHREGTLMRYRESSPTAAAPESQVAQVKLGLRDAGTAGGANPAPAPPARDAIAEARWRERLAPLLADEMRIVDLQCGPHACRLEGEAATMVDVSRLLRGLDAAGGTTAELLLIEQVAAGTYRFELRLPAA